jgi:hypothetical protein
MPRPFADFFLNCRTETHFGNRQTKSEWSIIGANGWRKSNANPSKISEKIES